MSKEIYKSIGWRVIENIKIEICGSLGHIKNNVNIPRWWYKIIFRIDGKIISFLVLNSNKVGRDKAKKYLSSVREIEKVCGIKIKEKKL